MKPCPSSPRTNQRSMYVQGAATAAVSRGGTPELRRPQVISISPSAEDWKDQHPQNHKPPPKTSSEWITKASSLDIFECRSHVASHGATVSNAENQCRLQYCGSQFPNSWGGERWQPPVTQTLTPISGKYVSGRNNFIGTGEGFALYEMCEMQQNPPVKNNITHRIPKYNQSINIDNYNPVTVTQYRPMRGKGSRNAPTVKIHVVKSPILALTCFQTMCIYRNVHLSS